MRDKTPAVLPINIILSIKVHGSDFFKQVIQRYSIITRSDWIPSLILLRLRLLENAGGKTKLTNVNKNNIKKILNTSIRQYLNLYVTIQSRENVIIPNLYFNNALSYGRHVPEQQVNIRTGLAKDTKHIVIPRLISYLQRIDDQESGYGFLPASAKPLETTELMRTLPERMVYHRERSENTVIFSNNPYPESDIRIIKHTLQPIVARTSQEKTQYQNSVRPKTASLSEKKYPDTDDIRTDFTKERSKGTVIFSNTPYHENYIRIIRHTLQPTMARTSQPVMARTSQPVMARISQPTMARISQPTMARISQLVMARISQSVMARTSQEKTQYRNSVRPKTASLSKKYPDTDDIRTDYTKERSKGTVILSNNPYPESDIRIIRHILQPTIARISQPIVARTSQEKTQYRNSVRPKTASLSKKYPDKDDNFVFAGIEKTQASGIQIEKTGNFSELQHLKMPVFPLFDEYTNPIVADIPEVGVSENTKARDIILYPLTHMEEKNPKINAIMAHIQKRNKLVYEKYEDFSKRTTDRYLLIEKNNIANKLISNTYIARLRMANMETEAGEVTEIPQKISLQETPQEIPKLLFDQDGIFLQHVKHAQTGMSAPLNLSSNDIVKRSSGLVLRKSAVHSEKKGFENTGKPDITKTERTKINAEKENIIGTNVQARDSIDDIATIATIADRVYKLLETRIIIEKERRGL